MDQYDISLSRTAVNPHFSMVGTCTPNKPVRIRMCDILAGIRNQEVGDLVSALDLKLKTQKRRGRRRRFDAVPQFNHISLEVRDGELNVSQFKSGRHVQLNGLVLPDSAGRGFRLTESGKHRLKLGPLEFDLTVVCK